MIKRINIIAFYLTSFELPFLSLCVLVSMVSSRALPWVVVIGAGFWLVRWLNFGYLTKQTPADLSIILLAIMLVVTVWVTALPATTYPQVYRLITGVLIYYSIINWTSTNQRFRLVIIGIIFASLTLAFYTPISVNWSFFKLPIIPKAVYGYFPNLVTDMIHRNVMAGSLVLILPITLGLLVFSWKQFNRLEILFLLVSALLVVGMLILTQSRGAIIALGAVLLTLIIMRFHWGWVLVPISILGLLSLVLSIGVDRIIGFLSSGVSLTGLEGRLDVWSRAIYMIQDFPITGIGMGSYGEVVDLLYPLFLAVPGSVPHAHNLFLQVTVDLGIPGIIAWLSILLITIVISIQVFFFGKSQADSMISGVGAGILCSQVALVVHGLYDAVTWGMVRPAPVVWIIWGLAITSWNIYVRGHEINKNSISDI